MATKMYVLFLVGLFIVTSHGQSTRNCTLRECKYKSIQAAEIQCQGEQSCQGSSLTSNNKASGFIDCSGSRSCDSRNVNYTQYPSTITAANNVYCSGESACFDSGAITAKNIYCTGSSACALYTAPDSFTLSADKNIFCYSATACHSRTLEPGKKVVCGGRYGCYGTTIRGGTIINCDGEGGCAQAALNNQRRLACCAGSRACDQTVIRNTAEVRAYGQTALNKAKVTNVELIKAYGSESLSGATIDSGSAATMTVQVFGDSAGSGATIICQSGSTCSIACKGNGCSGLTYVCLSGATCNYNPTGCLTDNSIADINGVSCPTFTDTLTLKDDIEELDTIDVKADRRGNCNAKRECVGETIDQYYTFCNGEESCLGANINDWCMWVYGSRALAETVINCPSSEDNMKCESFQGCYDADITAGSWDGSRFECQGSQSCMRSDMQMDTAICQGKYSCSRATISITKRSSITFGGYFSASRSTIYKAKTVNLNGYKALYLGIVDSNGSVSVGVNANGHLAGDGGSVLCRAGTICKVNCKGSGCSNLDYVCETGATCNIDPGQCDGSKAKHQGIDCPIRTVTSNANVYMEWKYHMNKDIYDAYDEYLDNIMDIDDYEDWEDIIGMEQREMIFGENIKLDTYSQMDQYNIALISGIGLVIGFIAYVWYLLCIKNDNKKEYVAI